MFFKYSPESFAHPDGIQGHWGETHCYRKGEIKKSLTSVTMITKYSVYNFISPENRHKK